MVRIEYSAYCRKYFVFTGNNRGQAFVTTRKDKAIRHAKSLNATEPELKIHTRNVLKDLVGYNIMSKEAAIKWQKEHNLY